MFTGLIEEVGVVLRTETAVAGSQLQVAAPHIAETTQVGDSVAVNGCCLTLTTRRGGELTFDLLAETLARTNLKMLRRDDRINLERAATVGGRLGGHFVQGHIDCTARLLTREDQGADLRIEIELPGDFARYVASKGSIAINGVSLTVAEVAERSFTVWIIPHTKQQTNLATIRRDDLVNLEFDLIAKYVERMVLCPP
jgi:riboflavin synthase